MTKQGDGVYWTYVLISLSKPKTYTGITSDINRRLKEHNSGKEKTTKPYLPYKLLHLEEHKTLRDARRREIYFKSTSGRRTIRRLLKEVDKK